MMKKILAILLAAMMLFSVVACGGNNADTNNDGNNDNTNDDTVNDTTPDTGDDEPAVGGDEPAVGGDDEPTVGGDDEPAAPTTDYAIGVDDGNGNFIPTPAENTTGWVLWNAFANEASMMMFPEMAGNYLMQQPYVPFSGGAMPIMPDPEMFYDGFGEYQIEGYAAGAKFMPMMGSIPFVGYIFDLAEGADVKAFIDQLVNNCNPRWYVCVEADQIVAGSVGNRVFFLMAPKDMITSSYVAPVILTPDVAEGSNAASIWNAFEAYMNENTEATAGDVANALAESAFVGTVTVAESALDHEIFKYGVDGFLSAAYIESEGKTVYVIQLEMGYDIENWASYMFDGIEAPYGAYGMTILLMVNVD